MRLRESKATLCLQATQADRAVIVATPDYASVRGADVLEMKLREAGIDERYYVINKVKAQMMDAEGVPSFGEIGMLIRSKVIGVIPYDDNIDFSVSLGTPGGKRQQEYNERYIYQNCKENYKTVMEEKFYRQLNSFEKRADMESLLEVLKVINSMIATGGQIVTADRNSR